VEATTSIGNVVVWSRPSGASTDWTDAGAASTDWTKVA
jgi:hypothetical protein